MTGRTEFVGYDLICVQELLRLSQGGETLCSNTLWGIIENEVPSVHNTHCSRLIRIVSDDEMAIGDSGEKVQNYDNTKSRHKYALHRILPLSLTYRAKYLRNIGTEEDEAMSDLLSNIKDPSQLMDIIKRMKQPEISKISKPTHSRSDAATLLGFDTAKTLLQPGKNSVAIVHICIPQLFKIQTASQQGAYEIYKDFIHLCLATLKDNDKNIDLGGSIIETTRDEVTVLFRSVQRAIAWSSSMQIGVMNIAPPPSLSKYWFWGMDPLHVDRSLWKGPPIMCSIHYGEVDFNLKPTGYICLSPECRFYSDLLLSVARPGETLVSKQALERVTSKDLSLYAVHTMNNLSGFLDIHHIFRVLPSQLAGRAKSIGKIQLQKLVKLRYLLSAKPTVCQDKPTAVDSVPPESTKEGEKISLPLELSLSLAVPKRIGSDSPKSRSPKSPKTLKSPKRKKFIEQHDISTQTERIKSITNIFGSRTTEEITAAMEERDWMTSQIETLLSQCVRLQTTERLSLKSHIVAAIYSILNLAGAQIDELTTQLTELKQFKKASLRSAIARRQQQSQSRNVSRESSPVREVMHPTVAMAELFNDQEAASLAAEQLKQQKIIKQRKAQQQQDRNTSLSRLTSHHGINEPLLESVAALLKTFAGSEKCLSVLSKKMAVLREHEKNKSVVVTCGRLARAESFKKRQQQQQRQQQKQQQQPQQQHQQQPTKVEYLDVQQPTKPERIPPPTTLIDPRHQPIVQGKKGTTTVLTFQRDTAATEIPSADELKATHRPEVPPNRVIDNKIGRDKIGESIRSPVEIEIKRTVQDDSHPNNDSHLVDKHKLITTTESDLTEEENQIKISYPFNDTDLSKQITDDEEHNSQLDVMEEESDEGLEMDTLPTYNTESTEFQIGKTYWLGTTSVKLKALYTNDTCGVCVEGGLQIIKIRSSELSKVPPLTDENVMRTRRGTISKEEDVHRQLIIMSKPPSWDTSQINILLKKHQLQAHPPVGPNRRTPRRQVQGTYSKLTQLTAPSRIVSSDRDIDFAYPLILAKQLGSKLAESAALDNAGQ